MAQDNEYVHGAVENGGAVSSTIIIWNGGTVSGCIPVSSGTIETIIKSVGGKVCEHDSQLTAIEAYTTDDVPLDNVTSGCFTVSDGDSTTDFINEAISKICTNTDDISVNQEAIALAQDTADTAQDTVDALALIALVESDFYNGEQNEGEYLVYGLQNYSVLNKGITGVSDTSSGGVAKVTIADDYYYIDGKKVTKTSEEISLVDNSTNYIYLDRADSYNWASSTNVAHGLGVDIYRVATGVGTVSSITRSIFDYPVEHTHLSDDSVRTRAIRDGNVTVDKLATDSVETAKIKDLNVTEDKIAAGAVTEDKIGALAITNNKIDTDAITLDKMADDSVDESNIKSTALGTTLTGGSGTVLNVVTPSSTAVTLLNGFIDTHYADAGVKLSKVFYRPYFGRVFLMGQLCRTSDVASVEGGVFYTLDISYDSGAKRIIPIVIAETTEDLSTDPATISLTGKYGSGYIKCDDNGSGNYIDLSVHRMLTSGWANDDHDHTLYIIDGVHIKY